MEPLKTYLNNLKRAEQVAFANRCLTSVGYLRNAISRNKRFGVELCISIERESGGIVRCEMLRPDVDWAYLRSSKADAA